MTRKIENFVRIFHLSKKPPPQTELGKNELHRDSSQTKGEIWKCMTWPRDGQSVIAFKPYISFSPFHFLCLFPKLQALYLC